MSQSASKPHASLHPLASRQGLQTSTIVPLDAPSSSNAALSVSEAKSRQGWQPDDYETPKFSARASIRNVSPSLPIDPASSSASSSSVYGIQHDNLEDYPIVYDLALSASPGNFDKDRDPWSDQSRQSSNDTLLAPIRAMSAAQFDQLHDQYVGLDVPQHVVFPFLHGVDGSIPAQNLFFNAPKSGQPAPNYRGLTIVRADMPSAEELQRINMAKRSQSSSRTRASTFSSVNTQSSSSSPESDDGYSGDPTWQQQPRSDPMPLTGSSHHVAEASVAYAADPSDTSPAVVASTSSTFSSLSRPSLFSLSSERYSAGSRTSVSTISDIVDEPCKYTEAASASRQSSPTSSDPQPRHSMLNSTVFPCEILRPPSVSRKLHGRKSRSDPSSSINLGDEDDHSEVRRVGPTFLNPAQSPGISLRNFKTQCAKYATISDIVLYCPAGYHAGVLTLAKWICEAQAALRKERLQRGWGGLLYNVFVVTESFDMFEHRYAHLVSVDSHGFSRNRVDLVEREREEMERLTRASEIDDNVWLGCTADAPGSTSDNKWGDDGPMTPDDSSNPDSFAICIQNLENIDPPTAASLRSASQYLDLFESDRRKLRLDQDELFDFNTNRSYLRDPDSRCESRNGVLVLGPNGWTPKSYHSSMQSDLSAARDAAFRIDFERPVEPRKQDDALRVDASDVLHLEFPASGDRSSQSEWDNMMANKVLEMCSWIKQQACPGRPSTAGFSGSSPAASSRRNIQDGSNSTGRSFSPFQGHGRRSSHGNPRSPPSIRQPRRVLLHCADGYTETSVLALAYLMFSRELSLPEAYLDLQLRACRSFFVYPSDVPVLEKIESMLTRSRSVRNSLPSYSSQPSDPRRIRHASSRSYGGPLFSEEQSELREVSFSSATSKQSSMADASHSAHLAAAKAGGICRTSTPTPRSAQVTDEAAKVVDHSWFEKKRFDGAFPSRILPFLYLGNLAHASNVGMLRALGITHLVSVGETALAPPDHINAKVNTRKDESRYQRASSKAAMSKDPRTVPSLTYESDGITVLNVRNVSDDGIDSLRGTMREAVHFIESARLSGGKVLVHCRVGVSRSTTVVLAYVMAYLDLGLVESYLLVRSRRLNIVIQPHLLFLWELRGWECLLHKIKKQQASILRSNALHVGGQSPESLRAAFSRLSAHSFRGCSGRSEEGSDTYQSAHSSPSGSPAVTAMSVDEESESFELEPVDEELLLNVEIGAGAGSVHGFDVMDTAVLPFGSGSPAGLSYKSTRLMWGHLAREIADLNSRYFV